MTRRWRRNSVFGTGPRVPLTEPERARFRSLAEQAHRAGRITRAGRDVALALLRRLGVGGQCDPSYETLASDVGCCRRTVATALADLAKAGLLRWQRRIARTVGNAVEQITNAYELAAPIVAGFLALPRGERFRRSKPLALAECNHRTGSREDISSKGDYTEAESRDAREIVQFGMIAIGIRQLCLPF